VRNSFTKLRHALDLREKLLLRQLDVLQSAPDKNQVDFCEITFQTDTETQVLEFLRNYGAYQNIDCYLPYLENENENEGMLYEKSFDPNSIDNKKLSESIINLTLKESQNLITKSTDLVTSVGEALKLESMGKALPSVESDSASIKQKSGAKVKQQQSEDGKLKRNEATTSSKKKTLKNISNLTLNNCGGSIILKNISNLTINTCKQSPKAKDSPAPPIKPCTTSKSCDGTFYQCDFYERLISENEVLKRSIVNQSLCTTTFPDPIARTCMSPPASKDRDDGTYSINSAHGDTTTNSSIMEEVEDGLPSKHEQLDEKIEEITTRTMMADGLMNHPPMIQCWLNKMLLETETEAQNVTEFLEISNIV
jgi:hypothetical protein